MANGHYNTYTVSDSDNDSIIVVENHRINRVSIIDDCPSTPEEPAFFQQVLEQQKRKKSPSPEINIDHNDDKCLMKEIVQTNECKDIYIGSPQTNIHKPNLLTNVEMHNGYRIEGLDTKNNEETIEMIQPKRKKRLTKEEINEKKKEENARKDAKKRLVEELKRLNPKECLKYITVHIDLNLHNREYSEQILLQIQSTDAKFKIETNSFTSHSVTWSRQKSDTVSEDEDFMLLIWDFEYVKDLITSDQLIKKINHLKCYKSQLSIIIYSSTEQLKQAKSKKKNQLSWSDMLNSLQHMMLSYHVSFRFVDNNNDIGLAIFNITKSIAQKPYKLNKYKEEQEGCDWYASGHTKNCVTVDKNGTGLTQLWRQMLSQFPLCALETSEAIASMYGSPVTLLEAYDKCSSRLEGETLLQDIPVRRGFGPLASNRRIGPELSKKIYTFFTDNTGYTTLSQE